MKRLASFFLAALLIVFSASACSFRPPPRQPSPVTSQGASVPRESVAAVNLPPVSQTFLDQSFTVGARNYKAWGFSVNLTVRLSGRFRAEGGGGNDVECFIVDADAYENWVNGHSVHTAYNSGRATVGNISAVVPQGRYFIVFNNRYSLLTPKAVTATLSGLAQ